MDTTILPAAPTATADDIRQATGFMVVCQRTKGPKGCYAYDHFPTLGEAAEYYEEVERGEWRDLYATALMACRHGVPFAKFSAWRMADLGRAA